MWKNLVVWLMLGIILTASCSLQNKLNRIYKGKNESFVISKLGKPIEIENLTSGNKVEIFEKQTQLSKVPINTGQFRYDSFDSPKSTKIETYKFEMNHSGIVENVSYECTYAR